MRLVCAGLCITLHRRALLFALLSVMALLADRLRTGGGAAALQSAARAAHSLAGRGSCGWRRRPERRADAAARAAGGVVRRVGAGAAEGSPAFLIPVARSFRPLQNTARRCLAPVGLLGGHRPHRLTRRRREPADRAAAARLLRCCERLRLLH